MGGVAPAIEGNRGHGRRPFGAERTAAWNVDLLDADGEGRAGDAGDGEDQGVIAGE